MKEVRIIAVQIHIQHTPNPNAVRVGADAVLFEGPKSTSVKAGESSDHPLAAALVAIDGVDNIFGMRDFVTVSKLPDADWDSILPQVEEAFRQVYE
ncbi:scaffolding protein [Saccharibacillus sp. VR-M41]|uniref:Scaffolding protein n=2 Tax=Saccharibacillus alkalitolerans TaxID=2705290 RepID=A0ABX0F3J6_9BACL|nr:scaffolding protein [Saccharibacillus alkalitolerans]